MATQVRAPGRPAGATRAAVLDAATERFLRGQRIDLAGLSSELGVSRPTLYRWFGSRDGLVGEVLAMAFLPFHEQARRRAGQIGLARAIVRLAEDLAAAAPLRAFLESEREVALHILTSSAGPVQPQTVALLSAHIDEQVAAGRCDPPTDSETVAYAITRLVEAFLYNDAVAGVRTDIGRLLPLLEAVLRPIGGAAR
jgi:AcrR family transcriptional regulator